MVFSPHVQKQLFGIPSRADIDVTEGESRVIRLPLTQQDKNSPSKRRSGIPWSTEEHDRFLDGLEIFPTGPWKAIAEYVGTRTPRQTMTHAQKYRQKIERSQRVNQVAIAKQKKMSNYRSIKSQPALSPTSVDNPAILSFESVVCAKTPSPRAITMDEPHCKPNYEPAACSNVAEARLEDLLDDEAINMLLKDLLPAMPIVDVVYDHARMYVHPYEDLAMWPSMQVEW